MAALPPPEPSERVGTVEIGVLHKLGEDVTESLEVVPRASGRWSSMCARSSRAAPARLSPSRRPRRIRSHGAAPDPKLLAHSCDFGSDKTATAVEQLAP